MLYINLVSCGSCWFLCNNICHLNWMTKNFKALTISIYSWIIKCYFVVNKVVGIYVTNMFYILVGRRRDGLCRSKSRHIKFCWVILASKLNWEWHITSNPSAWQVEMGGWIVQGQLHSAGHQVWGQPGLDETLSQKKYKLKSRSKLLSWIL